ncbi:hypothetical protein KKH23_09105, partial [Patescibacteria group bacterium]|nr:hypothetical protein [Patescibacteria group bacterium]
MKKWTTTSLNGTPVNIQFIETGPIGEQSLTEYEPLCFPLNYSPTQNGHQYEQEGGLPVVTFYNWNGTGEDHTVVIRQGTDSGGGEDHVRGFGAFVGRLGIMTQPLYVGLQHRDQSQGDPYSWIIGVEIPVSYIPSGVSGWVIVTFPEPWISGDNLDILALSYEPYLPGVGWVWGYATQFGGGLYPYGSVDVWERTVGNPTPHWQIIYDADMMFVLLKEGGINCWKCLDPPGDCKQCGGDHTCEIIQGEFGTEIQCELLSECGAAPTYNCYKCDNPGSPCVLYTGLPNPCDESTYFTTQSACHNATACQTGPTDPIVYEFLTCDTNDYEHCWDYGAQGSCEGDPLCEWYEHWPGCGPITLWNWHPPAKSTFQHDEIVWVYGRFDCDYPDPWGCGGWQGKYIKWELWKEGGATPESTNMWGPLGDYGGISLTWWLGRSPGNYTVKAYWGETSSCPNYLGSTTFTILSPPCEEIFNQTDCTSAGCYWYNGGCHSSSPNCEAINNQTDCGIYGCYWYNGSCHSSSPNCEIINNEPECVAYNCYWYEGSCHSEPYTGEPSGGIHLNTTYFTGPFPPGTLSTVINPLVISNIGDGDGQINWAIYEEGNPNPIVESSYSIPSGGYHSFGPIQLTTPYTPGIWNLCLTAWADGYENEPICGYLSMHIQ